ncbi:DUF4037 domain-containing protein [Rhizobium leguminosarum]|nr:DUF4037 domain-containing protein [Rhizobium leguminosarum]TBG07583.1 DUF4037 domain-containing protein [Rhizobium leguminosarum]TBG30831.1 DUF4037 domain-containing protein [Rhizobium leguminosarum]TBG50035.1 DUF4037 domain-containing protein [Rhizobium leguminosarum]TBG71320.1 DUF4037 domain-containing protein [Rhizobium leguminosarum]
MALPARRPWNRIAEERAYVGRAGDVGDELGSRIIAARMVGNIMRLAMLIERRYAPTRNGSALPFRNCGAQPTSRLSSTRSSHLKIGASVRQGFWMFFGFMTGLGGLLALAGTMRGAGMEGVGFHLRG